jgi:PIN domain nuclease of toxin-antitoxin system
MEDLVYLDTHVIVWLYAGRVDLIGDKVQDIIENNNVLISPIVELELQYLLETERIKVDPDKIITALTSEIGLKICELDFNRIIMKAISLYWTRDPFDRIITAQASIEGKMLITKDRTILNNYKNAIW